LKLAAADADVAIAADATLAVANAIHVLLADQVFSAEYSVV